MLPCTLAAACRIRGRLLYLIKVEPRGVAFRATAGGRRSGRCVPYSSLLLPSGLCKVGCVLCRYLARPPGVHSWTAFDLTVLLPTALPQSHPPSPVTPVHRAPVPPPMDLGHSLSVCQSLPSSKVLSNGDVSPSSFTTLDDACLKPNGKERKGKKKNASCRPRSRPRPSRTIHFCL